QYRAINTEHCPYIATLNTDLDALCNYNLSTAHKVAAQICNNFIDNATVELEPLELVGAAKELYNSAYIIAAVLHS
ncbi:hypothetical protein HK096_010836, partial [Nowakowskiella sp. JEL0078]